MIRLNHFESRAELIEAAVSETSGEVTFYESPSGDDGTHSIHQDWQEEKRVLGKVQCRTLKEIIGERRLPQVDFLKIDTEGNDLKVLQGLAEYCLPEFTKLIYVETTRDGESICRLMADNSYVGFTTLEMRGRELTRRFRNCERGGQASFFRPLETDSDCGHNTLWCGKESSVAAYLRDLAVARQA